MNVEKVNTLGAQPASDPIAFPAYVVFNKVAREFDRVAHLLSNLEDSVLVSCATGLDRDALTALQSIDLMQQSISALSDFLQNTAADLPKGELDITLAVSQIRLGDMRRRLSEKSAQEIVPRSKLTRS